MSPLLIPTLLWLVPLLLLVVAAAWLWRNVIRPDRRRSPITMRLVNLPGDQLRLRIHLEDQEVVSALLVVFMTGPLFFVVWGLWRLREIEWRVIPLGIMDVGFLAAAMGVLVFYGTRVIRHSRRRRQCIEGLRAELATAQQLQRLIPRGCMVFHDVPAETPNGKAFNIDHVVIGPHAVFAVETKSRKKPKDGGKASATVRYDGKRLFFPGGVNETRVVDQAEAQAVWF